MAAWPFFKKTFRRKLDFSRKLALGMVLLSALGLAVMFAIVNTVVRGIVYDNAVYAARSGTTVHTGEIDSWLKRTNHLVEHIAVTWRTTGVDPGAGHGRDPIAASFVEEFDFFEDVFVGFGDGRFVGGGRRLPDPEWDATAHPWHAAAAASPGQIVTLLAYSPRAYGHGVVATLSKWVPDLGGTDAVVAVDVRLDHVLDVLARYRALGAGYMVLLGPTGEIVFHDVPHYNPGPAGLHMLADIPGGDRMAAIIASGRDISRFDDFRLGPSYLMPFPLATAGWILVAVVPAAVTQRPVMLNMAAIMAALALLLLAMASFTVFLVSRFAKSMEESRVAEERMRLVFDNMPMASNLHDRENRILFSNSAARKLFGLEPGQEYLDRFLDISPEFQPDGIRSREKAAELVKTAYVTGRHSFEWMHRKTDGEPLPCEITVVRVGFGDGDYLLTFVKDMREFHDAKRKLRAMLDSSPMTCALFDDGLNIIEANQEVVPLFGLSHKNEYIERFFELAPEFQPDGIASKVKARAALRKTLECGEGYLEWMHQTFDGDPIPVEVHLKRVRLGDRDFVIAHARDLRDFYKYKKTESVAQQRLQAMLDSSPLACNIVDENFSVLEVNQEMLKLLEVDDRQEYIDRFFDFSPRYQPDGRLSTEKLAEKAKIALETGRAHFEWMNQTLDGKSIPCEKTVVSVTLDGRKLLIGYTRDLREIHETFAMVRQLEKLAFTDTLTGARNRRYFTETAERELYSCIDGGLDFAIILFDIDHFKLVNDTHGHDVGDEVLKIVVARAVNSLKRGTLVARYGGEEFVVVLVGTDHGNAVTAAWHVREKIAATPFVLENLEIAVTVSLGVASMTESCSTLPDIVKNADRALYRAKQTGRNRVVSYEEMSSSPQAAETGPAGEKFSLLSGPGMI